MERHYHTNIVPADSAEAIREAERLLREGEVIAMPTDTVYGVACDVWQPAALERLYLAKQRPRSLPIPLLIASYQDVSFVAHSLSQAFIRLAAEFWPGELTLIAQRLPQVPELVAAGGATIALRVPADGLVQRLCRALGGALAATSANLSGSPAACTAQAALNDLNGRIPLILDGGPCSGGVASSIVDCTVDPPRLLRSGNISLERLQRSIPEIVPV